MSEQDETPETSAASKSAVNSIVMCRFKFSIDEFRDGSLSLSCSDNGMESDLVFASGAMTGNPVLEEQKAILDCIVSSFARLNDCEELLKHATDIVDRLPEDEDTKWVLDKTDAYFVDKHKDT